MNVYKLDLNKKGNQINSIDDWYEAAPPQNPSLHWKDGRSAKELAKYMISGNGYIPAEIENILVQLGCNPNITFYGEPEAVTSLEGRGGGRHHDLLLVQENEVVVGVEAKSDEDFGEVVHKELFGNNDYEKLIDTVSDNKLKRVNSLYNDIYWFDFYKNLDLRYQLLTATGGILKEAQKANASKAVLLVLTLKKKGCYSEKKVEANLQDLKNYVASLGTPSKDGHYNLPGYPDIDFYVKHIEIDV